MTPTVSNRDPRLAGLEIRATTGGSGRMTPDFSPGVFRYSIEVQSDIREIDIVPAGDRSALAAISINGKAAESGSPAVIALAVGENAVNVTAKGKAGKAVTYTLIVKRQDIGPVAAAFRKLELTDPETGITMGYRLFVPRHVDEGTAYPLVLFLHGAGESGSDNEIQLTANEGATIWAKPQEQARHPCFVLAPQNPKDPAATSPMDFGRKGWTSLMRLGFDQPFAVEPSLRTARAILQKVMADYPVDPKRVYGTGLSMGGFGIYAMAAEYPGTFAAVVGICGGLDPGSASRLAHTPVWAFHGAADPTVNVKFSRDTVEALRKAGGSPRYTEYGPDVFFKPDAHLSWIPAYASVETRDWLFQRSR
jgi:predicted peptidase